VGLGPVFRSDGFVHGSPKRSGRPAFVKSRQYLPPMQEQRAFPRAEGGADLTGGQRIAFGHEAGWRGKRIIDILAVILMAPAALLIVALAALTILITSGRPVFFVQKRVGFLGREFWMYKLRTMATNCEHLSPTSKSDPRIILFGHLLRTYRIDELPQLYNVLKGDMSMIGPRPEQPHLVDAYRLSIEGFDDRHRVKPGITGVAQVMYQYAGNAKETRKKLKYDLFYIRHCSIGLDLNVALRTIVAVMRGSGAR
jgi:lipopolysaccharide/colanic/teichoic acid biosynthesis glycosyltransferase